MFGFDRPRASDIRRLDAAHGVECAALHADCFPYSWPADEFEALLVASTTVADGAFAARDLHGFILSRVAADEAEVLTILVARRRRGAGIAGQLLAANLRQLAVVGAKSLYLEVGADNAAALALYRRFAFERVGERKSYYRKPDGTAALAYVLRRTID